MSDTIVFFVQSSSSTDVYELKAMRRGSVSSFVCSCPAGQIGVVCKHRINLSMGDVTNLLVEHSDDPNALANLFRGTPLENSLAALHEMETQAGLLKRKIAAQRKIVARHMFGQS